MYIYLTLYTLVVFLSSKVDQTVRKENKRLYLFIIFSLLACFATFRADLGTDIGRYSRDYNAVLELPIFSISTSLNILNYDIFYSLLNVIFGNILKLDFWTIKLFIASIFFFGFYKFSEKINNYTVCSIIFIPILYYFFSFSLLRQSISICIGLYLMVLIIEKRYLKSLLVTLIGVLFHKYFFIFFPIIFFFYILSDLNNKKKIITYLLILFFFTILFVSFNTYSLKGHFNWYVLTSPANHTLQFPIIKLFFINYAYFIIFYFITLSKNDNFDSLDKLIFIFTLFGLFFLFLYPISNIVTLRFMMFLIVINPLIILKLMKFFENKFNNTILTMLFLLHCFYMVFFFNFSSHSGSFIPYNFYFF